MMVRVRTPLFTRNPYLFGDATWGVTYVAHGLAGVALVGLVIAHVYFAVRPEKWWITKSMILGWITRRQYLEHHDPAALGRQWRNANAATRQMPARHARLLQSPTNASWHDPDVLTLRRRCTGVQIRTDPRCDIDLKARCDAIEECYEFMLAYAAQGVVDEAGSQSAGQLRMLLDRAEAALARSGGCVPDGRRERRLEPSVRYAAFIGVLDRDARAALAAVQLVIAQPSISSQLDRQPERVDPRARAAHRPVPDRRNPEKPRSIHNSQFTIYKVMGITL